MNRSLQQCRRSPISLTAAHSRFGLVMFCLLVALAQMGCRPAAYRQQADADAYCLVDRAATDPRWEIDDYTIEVDPSSRMYDPDDPDHPPMPPDDPTAHRLMHCVDCKKGYCCWHANGDTPFVENPHWREYLPLNEKGELVLDMRGAVGTALVHSRLYQRQEEELYLSALDVSFERFRFDTQFFAGHETFFTADGAKRSGAGGESSSVLDVSVFPGSNRLRATKLFTTGGEAVVGVANSLVWEFSGPDNHSATTLLDFSLVQPLLRGAGRAVVMERLTDSERNLLANVRQMERFRRGFYTLVVSGDSAGRGPLRAGGFLGDLGTQTSPGIGGYYRLLLDVQEIRNQRDNVAALRGSVARLDALRESQRINLFQVDLARQALYNSQSRLLARSATFQRSMDAFKIQLGLPPDVPLVVDDPILKQLELIDPAISQSQDRVRDLQEQVGKLGDGAAPGVLREILTKADALKDEVNSHLEVVVTDHQRLLQVLPQRRQRLQELASRSEVADGDVDRALVDPQFLNQRVSQLERDLASIRPQFEAIWKRIEVLKGDPGQQQEPSKVDVAAALAQLDGEILELTLIQARIRVDSITLSSAQLDSKQALDIARVYRLDWMNARAALVDAWRQIKVSANDLRGSLDVVFSGDMSNTGDNPLRLDANTGRLRVGVEIDAPLTRLAERNVYRETLIRYQRARRDFYTFVDRVSQGLRDTIRTIRLNDLDFEVRREAVHVAITQVDQARLAVSAPPKPNQQNQQLGDTAARDLVTALSGLLNAQNDLINVWVNQEIQRLSLDFDLGTMQLDGQGLWIDPGDSLGQVDLDGPYCDPTAENETIEEVPPLELPELLLPEPRPSATPEGTEPPQPAE